MRRVVAVAAVVVSALTASAGPAATGIKVVSGHYERSSWTLLADDTTSGSFDITMLVGSRLSSSEGGMLDLKGTRGVTYLGHRGRPSPNYIVGPVVSTATHVVITYANRRRISVPTIHAPAGLAPNLSFYVHVTGCQTVRATRIAGVDAHGQIVASITIPTRLGPRTTC